MAVHLTRIYTRTGDSGTTALGDMSRVSKNDPRLIAYADVDEANSIIGVTLALSELPEEVRTTLVGVQNDLFDVGADLCTPIVPEPKWVPLRITEDYVSRLEAACDRFNADLPKLDSFLLPGGTPGAAFLHQARTVVRRAERSVWAALDVHADSVSELPARYLNRLSDLLFILSRLANGGNDILWQPGGQPPAARRRTASNRPSRDDETGSAAETS